MKEWDAHTHDMSGTAICYLSDSPACSPSFVPSPFSSMACTDKPPQYATHLPCPPLNSSRERAGRGWGEVAVVLCKETCRRAVCL